MQHIKKKIMNTNRKGDFAEYYAVTWLWDHGYEVFQNSGCTGPIDMIAMNKKGEMVLIDVKTVHPNNDNDKSPNCKKTRTKKQIKLAKALEMSSKTLKAFPKSAEYIDTLSEVYYAQGKTDESIAKIKEALKLVPNDAYYKQQLWRFKNIKPKKPAA